jgi:hypothetical protein
MNSAAIAATDANQTSASDDRHSVQGEFRNAGSNSFSLTCSTAATSASVELVSILVHYVIR